MDFEKVYEFVHNLNWTHIRRLLSENKKEGESSGYDTPSFFVFYFFFFFFRMPRKSRQPLKSFFMIKPKPCVFRLLRVK